MPKICGKLAAVAIVLGAAMFGEFVNQTGVHQALLGVVKGSGCRRLSR